ncbi:MAG: hypothetical protein H7210_03545 [Pyrinomonadaceae bacterium]|nr:hypothetical protein [Phycisphaerales bacterium]
MKLITSRGSSLLAALLLGAGALLGATFASAKTNPPANNKNKTVPTPAPAFTVSAYSGHATALRIEGLEQPVSGTIVLAATGALPNTGGSLEAHESDYYLYGSDGVTVGLGVEMAHATTVGMGTETNSDSSLTGFQVLFATEDGDRVSITADYIGASATAAIASDGTATAQGSVSISNLRVNGELIVVTGEPNQVVERPDVHLVINKQVIITVEGQADIMVSAIDFEICGCMFGGWGVVYAGITGSGTPPPETHDCGKLTGGGWIVGPSGAKATFAVSGGIRRGEFWGHLNYNDHGAGLKVKSTRVTGFTTKPGDHDCRIISYDVEINGLPGTAVVEACDHGEPGRNDTFSIRLSTGYAAGGSLGGNGPGGGNIQLHKCPPGWEK